MTTATVDVPMFLKNLHSILSNSKFADIISWSHNDKMFVIKSEDKLIQEVLPQFYKHSNLNSFVRQLHMYGFKKYKQGTCKNAYYYHKYFFKNESEMMTQIKRKLTTQQKRDLKVERKQASGLTEEVHLPLKPAGVEPGCADPQTDSIHLKTGHPLLSTEPPTF